MSFFSSALWLLTVIFSVSYVSHLYLASIAHSEAIEAGPVIIRDNLRSGEHHLSGMVTVSSPCDLLSVNAKKLSWNTYVLDFTSWNEPAILCEETPVPRSFNTTIFAPSIGISFIATLDGKPFPIIVQQVLPK